MRDAATTLLASLAQLKGSDTVLESISQDQVSTVQKKLTSFNDLTTKPESPSPESPKIRKKIPKDKPDLHSRKSTVESQDLFEKYTISYIEHVFFAVSRMNLLQKNHWICIIGKIVQF